MSTMAVVTLAGVGVLFLGFLLFTFWRVAKTAKAAKEILSGSPSHDVDESKTRALLEEYEEDTKSDKREVVRHLLDLGFVVSDDSSLDSFEECHGNVDLEGGLLEIFEGFYLYGYLDNHLLSFGRRRFSVDLFWRTRETEPTVRLDLDSRDRSSSPDSGMVAFDTASRGFNRLFATRRACRPVADKLSSAGAKLDFADTFAEQWGSITKQMRVHPNCETIEMEIDRDRFFTGSDLPGKVEQVLIDLEKLAATIEAAVDPSYVPAPAPRVDAPMYASIKLLHKCGGCGAGLPLNGPLLTVRCNECVSDRSISQEFWVERIEEAKRGYLRRFYACNINMATDYVWRAGRPCCAKCETELAVDDAPVGSNAPLRCPKCDAETSTYPAPDWLRQLLPHVEQFYGAEAEGAAGQVVDAVKPVVFSCPSCSGSLKIGADAERTTTCQFCDADVYLPDGLWKRLHPVKQASTWYVRFAPLFAPRTGKRKRDATSGVAPAS